MSCQKGQHDWKNVLEIPETDYEPSDIVWWCGTCGDVVRKKELDGRTIKEWYGYPTETQGKIT